MVSYRNIKEGELGMLYERCISRECEVEIRMRHRGIESGRWNEAMDKIHKVIDHLDGDEILLFARRHPGILNVVNEFAIIEDLKVFSKEYLRSIKRGNYR